MKTRFLTRVSLRNDRCMLRKNLLQYIQAKKKRVGRCAFVLLYTNAVQVQRAVLWMFDTLAVLYTKAVIKMQRIVLRVFDILGSIYTGNKSAAGRIVDL